MCRCRFCDPEMGNALVVEILGLGHQATVVLIFGNYFAKFALKGFLMKVVSYFTDETRNRRYAQIDLDGLAKCDNEALDDLFDSIIAEARKNEKSEKWESVKAELLKEGKIHVSNNNKTFG